MRIIKRVFSLLVSVLVSLSAYTPVAAVAEDALLTTSGLTLSAPVLVIMRRMITQALTLTQK